MNTYAVYGSGKRNSARRYLRSVREECIAIMNLKPRPQSSLTRMIEMVIEVGRRIDAEQDYEVEYAELAEEVNAKKRKPGAAKYLRLLETLGINGKGSTMTRYADCVEFCLGESEVARRRRLRWLRKYGLTKLHGLMERRETAATRVKEMGEKYFELT